MDFPVVAEVQRAAGQDAAAAVRPARELEPCVAVLAPEAPRQLRHVLLWVTALVERDVRARGEAARVQAGPEAQRDVHVGVSQEVAVWRGGHPAALGVPLVLQVMRALDDPGVREAEELGDGLGEVVVRPYQVSV